MGNTIANIVLSAIFAIVIIALALLAISEPISRTRSGKKSLKGAHRFTKRQAKLDQIMGGNK